MTERKGIPSPKESPKVSPRSGFLVEFEVYDVVVTPLEVAEESVEYADGWLDNSVDSVFATELTADVFVASVYNFSFTNEH
jgi:hypothetical protein